MALDTITEKVIVKDTRRKFRIDAARESLKVDILANAESLEKFTMVLESELEDMVTASWQMVTPKVKSLKGTPKGKGKGKGKKKKAKTEKENLERLRNAIILQNPKKDAEMVSSVQGTTGC